VEMGCDAGLFLKMAKDYGYPYVIGVEKNKTPHGAALRYRDALGYDYKILKRTLGGKFGEQGNFDIDELPVADITLLCTFHYHIDIHAWYKYVDRLKGKSCYVLVVSAPAKPRYHWRVNGHFGYVKKYFRDWIEINRINDVPQEGDPKPRELYSVLFKNPILKRVPIDAITTRTGRDAFGEQAIRELTRQVVNRRLAQGANLGAEGHATAV